MKKTLLNIAVSVAIAGAVFSTALSTPAYASEFTPVDNSSNSKTTETYMLPGMSAGAATGAVIAGPVGLLIGGVIGAVIGVNNEVDQTSDVTATDKALTEVNIEDDSELSDDIAGTDIVDSNNSIQLAQLGAMNTIVDEQSDTAEEKLMNILVTDLSLDVYFRSGSTDIEKFYPARLSAIADLINSMDKLELHLDVYTDRRGNKSQNIALANQRVEKVRQQLVDAGVADNRIISKGFGEIKMVSDAGDLEAYTFDRKVVIRFERTNQNSISTMTTALTDSAFDSEKAQTTSSTTEQGHVPVVADVSDRF